MKEVIFHPADAHLLYIFWILYLIKKRNNNNKKHTLRIIVHIPSVWKAQDKKELKCLTH